MPEQSPLELLGRAPPPAYEPQGHAFSTLAPGTILSVDVSSLLLPEHLRLTSRNWVAYKRAIPILSALRGVDEHLRRSNALALDETWHYNDTLCKAIILFNIKDGSHLNLGSGHAFQIWNALVCLHEQKKPCYPQLVVSITELVISKHAKLPLVIIGWMVMLAVFFVLGLMSVYLRDARFLARFSVIG